MKNLKLRYARIDKGWSQQELAQRCGVTGHTISRIEQGDGNPTINLCISISQALGKTLDELFWVTENNDSWDVLHRQFL